MRILQSIKSMNPENNKATCTEAPEQDSVLFGISRHEAGERIQNVVSSFVIQRKANASDTLRALCSQPANGEQLQRGAKLEAGDVLAISAQEFKDGFSSAGPHGMVAVVVDPDPLTVDIYELTNTIRNDWTLHLGRPLSIKTGPGPLRASTAPKIYFFLSPSVHADPVVRYINRNIDAGAVFKLKLDTGHVYSAFGEIVEKLETQRRALSKDQNSQAPMHYGTYKCNHFVHDIVKRSLEIRNNENNIKGATDESN